MSDVPLLGLSYWKIHLLLSFLCIVESKSYRGTERHWSKRRQMYWQNLFVRVCACVCVCVCVCVCLCVFVIKLLTPPLIVCVLVTSELPKWGLKKTEPRRSVHEQRIAR